MDRVRSLREELTTPSPTARPTCGSIKYYDALKRKHAEVKDRWRCGASSLSPERTRTTFSSVRVSTSLMPIALCALRTAATADPRRTALRLAPPLKSTGRAPYLLVGRASAFTSTRSAPAVTSSSCSAAAAESPFAPTAADDYAAQHAIAVSVAESALR